MTTQFGDKMRLESVKRDANFSPFFNEINGKKAADLSPISMRSPIKNKKIGDLTTYPTIVNIHILRGKFSEHFL